jgi:Fe-S oxidoreductase
MGYKDDFLNQASKNMAFIKKAGIKTLVTASPHAYHAFKVLYDKFKLKGELKVLHIAEYIQQLVKAGKLKPRKSVDIAVTYHDPCHLGRLGEPWVHWQGKKIQETASCLIRRRCTGAARVVYEPPRGVLKSIPGIRLTEMNGSGIRVVLRSRRRGE